MYWNKIDLGVLLMDNVCNKSKCCELWIFCVLQSGFGISIATTRHQVDVQDQPLIQELHSPVKGEFPENKLLILTRSIEIWNNCAEVMWLLFVQKSNQFYVLFELTGSVVFLCQAISSFQKVHQSMQYIFRVVIDFKI